MSAPLAAAAQALSTFDDFGAPRIDGGRWRGFMFVTEIGRCTNADCSVIRSLAGLSGPPGAWRTGVPYVLTVSWQPASDAFVFTVADGPTVSIDAHFGDVHLNSAAASSVR